MSVDEHGIVQNASQHEIQSKSDLARLLAGVNDSSDGACIQSKGEMGVVYSLCVINKTTGDVVSGRMLVVLLPAPTCNNNDDIAALLNAKSTV